MSEWLQITGHARISTRDIQTPNDFTSIENMLKREIGVVKNYHQSDRDSKLPKGSEGTMEWTLIDDTKGRNIGQNDSNFSISYMQNASIAFNGALRDVSSKDNFEKWLNEHFTGHRFTSLKDESYSIIDGVFHLHFSYDDNIYIYYWVDDHWDSKTIAV